MMSTGHSIPNDVEELIQRFQSENGTTLVPREIMLSGKSGAFVALVDCSGEHDGIFILKVGKIPTGYDDEITRHKKALKEGAFSGRIPAIVACLSSAGSYALLMKIAGSSRIAWRPLTASTTLFRSAYARLSDVLWTPNLAKLTDLVPAVSTVRNCLDYQMDGKKGGRIHKHAREYLSSALLTAPLFVHQGESLPNPLVVASKPDAHPSPSVRIIEAPVHGDCHAGNVFVKAKADAAVSDLCVIDLASYRSLALFFFDHAYLELATLLRRLENIGEHRWFTTSSILATFDEPALSKLEHQERAWAQDILKARHTALECVKRSYPDRTDDIRLQFILAQVAAGLSFLNKLPKAGTGSTGFSREQYQQALIWSALNLRQFDRALNAQSSPLVRPQKVASVPVIGGEVAPTSETLTEADWRKLGFFDSSGLNILVLPSTRSTEQVSELLKESWTLIIDLSTTAIPESWLQESPRLFRQAWPRQALPDLKVLSRGGLWYFANGRLDVSGVSPALSSGEWRRLYSRSLDNLLAEVANHVSPPRVRALIFADGITEEQLGIICWSLDTAFSAVLAPILIASWTQPATLPPSVELVLAKPDVVLQGLRSFREPSVSSSHVAALLPRRVPGESNRLEAVPADLLSRVSRDLTVVYRARSSVFPDNRVFGVDFRRGMMIEWSELAQNLDVERNAFSKFVTAIGQRLAESTNATINLLHEPSAGGTTLSRRLAWHFMESHPTVILDQLSAETSSIPSFCDVGIKQ